MNINNMSNTIACEIIRENRKKEYRNIIRKNEKIRIRESFNNVILVK